MPITVALPGPLAECPRLSPALVMLVAPVRRRQDPWRLTSRQSRQQLVCWRWLTGRKSRQPSVPRFTRRAGCQRRRQSVPTGQGTSQAYIRAKGQYPPSAVAWYLSPVHIARWYPSRAGPGRRCSESPASTALHRAAWSRQPGRASLRPPSIDSHSSDRGVCGEDTAMSNQKDKKII